MATQSIGTRKAAATAPLIGRCVGNTVGERSTTDELLLARVETLVTLAVVLAGKGLAANRADEWPLVCVGAEMGAEVVGSGEAFGAEMAFECRGVLLSALEAALAAAQVWGTILKAGC